MTLRLAAAGDRVELDPTAGGRLTSAVLGGRERLVTAPPGHVAPDLAHVQWGVFPMVPWAGRVAGGRLRWRGRTHRLEVGGDGHALHGTGVHAAWRVEAAGPDRATLATALTGRGWPFGGDVRHRVVLGPGSLACTLTVTAGAHHLPLWLGWHPCFARPAAGELHLRVDAPEVLATDGGVPTGDRRAVGGATDLRAGPALGDRRLDDAFVGASGPARLTWPDLVLEVALDRPTTWVVFTPDHEVCVEPQTGWPDALAQAAAGHPTGVVELAPGERASTTMTWRWTTA